MNFGDTSFESRIENLDVDVSRFGDSDTIAAKPGRPLERRHDDPGKCLMRPRMPGDAGSACVCFQEVYPALKADLIEIECLFGAMRYDVRRKHHVQAIPGFPTRLPPT